MSQGVLTGKKLDNATADSKGSNHSPSKVLARNLRMKVNKLASDNEDSQNRSIIKFKDQEDVNAAPMRHQFINAEVFDELDNSTVVEPMPDKISVHDLSLEKNSDIDFKQRSGNEESQIFSESTAPNLKDSHANEVT